MSISPGFHHPLSLRLIIVSIWAIGSPLVAPLPGSIFSLKCNVGDAVNKDDTVLVMESMKMESEVKAHQSGTIQSILVKEGDNVQTGDQLVTIG